MNLGRPARVIKQDDASTVFCNNAGSITRAAPEHLRPVSAVEARLIPKIPTVEDQSPCASNNPPSANEIPVTHSPPMVSNQMSPTPVTMPEDNPSQLSSYSASEQPDQEPKEMTITPNNSDENNPQSNLHENNHDSQEL